MKAAPGATCRLSMETPESGPSGSLGDPSQRPALIPANEAGVQNWGIISLGEVN